MTFLPQHASISRLASARSDVPASNNFDLVRLTLALVVVLWHIRVLSGVMTPILPLSADIAVQGFFVISGFLVCASYEASRSTYDYLIKRTFRIYPAYLCVVIFSVLLGAMLTTYDASHFFCLDLVKYIAANILFMNFLHPSMPGVFGSNILPAVNGALWTLKIEVCYYAVVPLISYGLRGRYPLLFATAVYASSWLFQSSMLHLHELHGSGFYLELSKQLPAVMTYFIAGSAAYRFKSHLFKIRHYIFLIALILWLLPITPLQPLLIGVLVLIVALTPRLLNKSRYGDFSYGIYIYHFPIAQTVISLGLFAYSPTLGVITILAMTILAAVVSWTMIEKPCLDLGKRLIDRSAWSPDVAMAAAQTRPSGSAELSREMGLRGSTATISIPQG